MVITTKEIQKLQNLLSKAGAKTKYHPLDTKKKLYPEVETLALDLGLQWMIMKEEGYSMLDIPPRSVRRYNNGHFVLDVQFLDDANLLVSIEDGKAIIDTPFEYGKRMAPELMFVIRLPAVCNPTAALYALKCLCVEQMDIKHNLKTIAGTKLYYLLERCSRPDPKERCFLFI